MNLVDRLVESLIEGEEDYFSPRNRRMRREAEDEKLRAMKYQGSRAILPYGTINLTTGAAGARGALAFDSITDFTGGNFILIQSEDGGLRLVYGAGAGGSDAVGTAVKAHHDQTRRFFPPATIIGNFPATAEGLAQVRQQIGKTTIPFGVYK